MNNYCPKKPPLAIAIQAHCLRIAQPDSQCRFTGRSGLVWNGSARPTPLSEQYRLRISYDLGYLPQTKVLQPELRRRGERKIPHMYDQENLCLFNPNKREWNDRMRIATTILPLACLWLYFYEVWLATGDWHGGGDHPDPPSPQPRPLRHLFN